MIHRSIENTINNNIGKGKAIIILGARQVGKSTLLDSIKTKSSKDTLLLDCNNIDIKKVLTDSSTSQLKRIIGNNEIIIIDEAQRIKNIGLTLKLITDQIKSVQLIVSGSSSFDLSNEINEPLTVRKFEYKLFPFSLKELVDHHGFVEENRNLEFRMVFGMYPDVVNNPGNEAEILENLSSSYLFRDIFTFQDMRKPEFLEKLLEALAFQVGSEVSFNELAQLLGSNSHTVEKYIQLLERAFIIFRLKSFNRNARNEIKKGRKIYFYDNGIRNAIIGNYSQLKMRTDIGALWENFVISERMKYLHYNKLYSKRYFWRTTQQQEIDYVEEQNGQLSAFEIKWNSQKKVKFPKTFSNNYPDAKLITINPDNIWDFVGV